MYFNTLSFFSFFLAVYLLFNLANRYGYGAAVLLLASAVFYAVAGVFDSLLIVCLIGLNWLIIKTIPHDKARIPVAVLLNIGILALIKYRELLFGDLAGQGPAYINTVLPLGISFYTFQLLAFQIDAGRDRKLKEQNGFSFALFVSFFPQLIAGPIVRARELLPQIRRLIIGQPRKLRLISFALGLCLLGLVKKVIFADSLAPIVDDIFFLDNPTTFEAWLGAWLFSFQIYFDFSGYSDIALGCAYLLGIRLPWNFRTPYMSISPREFWQRWHITLSTWIRDYLYIPLGGNKGNLSRQLLTLLFVMGVAGLWHGADLTFVVWGLGWGSYIAIARLINKNNLISAKWVRPLLWLGHMTVVIVLWVFFRASDIGAAQKYLSAMFSIQDFTLPDGATLALLGAASLMALHALEAGVLQSKANLLRLRRINHPLIYGVMFGLCLWLVMLPSYEVNPFIYFRF